MKTSTIKEFISDMKFTQIVPKIRTNVNSYPFITFINAKNKAENVYFSKKASELVTDDQIVTKELLSSLSIGYTTNKAGEERIKLISNSERVELANLID